MCSAQDRWLTSGIINFLKPDFSISITVEARRKVRQVVFANSVGRGLIAAVRAGADRDYVSPGDHGLDRVGDAIIERRIR